MAAPKKYPLDMFPPTDAPIEDKPVQAANEQEEARWARKGYTLTYNHRPFPTTVYDKAGEPLECGDPPALADALANGYSQTRPDPKAKKGARP